MATATSDVDICNLAMDLLNDANPIINISAPTTSHEEVCARWYDVTRRKLLRKNMWNFARGRYQASRDSIDPIFGYADAYNLPNNWLRLIAFDGENNLSTTRALGEIDFEIEGNQILLNNSGAASINLQYIKDITDVSKFDAIFVELFATQLAINMAFKLTIKNTVVTRLKILLEGLNIEAAAIDGQERPPRVIEHSKFGNARRRVRRGSSASQFIEW